MPAGLCVLMPVPIAKPPPPAHTHHTPALCGCMQVEIQSDLDFIRESLITTEVNIARVFNHDVKTRRDAKVRARALV